MSLISNLTVIGSSGLGGESSWLASYLPEKQYSGDDFNQFTGISVNSSKQIALSNNSDYNGTLMVSVVDPDGGLLQAKSYDVDFYGIHKADFDPSDRLVLIGKGSQTIATVRLNSNFNSVANYFNWRIGFQESGYNFGQAFSGEINNLITPDNDYCFVHATLDFNWNFGSTVRDVVFKVNYNNSIQKVGAGQNGNSGGSGLALKDGGAAGTLVWANLDYDDNVYNYYWQGNYTDRYDFATGQTGTVYTDLMTFNNLLYLRTNGAFYKANTNTGSVFGGKNITINGVVPSYSRLMLNDGNDIYFIGNITISSVQYIYIVKMNSAETVFEGKLIRGSSSNIFGRPSAKIVDKTLYLAVNYGTVYRDRAFVLKTNTLDIDGSYSISAQTMIISTATLTTSSVPNLSFSYLGSQSITDQNSSQTSTGSQAVSSNTSGISNLTEL